MPAGFIARILSTPMLNGTTSEYTIRQDLNDQAGVLRGQTAEPKAQEKIRRFALPDVAPLAPPDRNDLTGAADREALRPFGLTASPDIPYPTREMVKALLDERTKPLNTALVLPDAPHDTYYVAVVAQRLEKNDADFSRSVYSETGVSGARAALANARHDRRPGLCDAARAKKRSQSGMRPSRVCRTPK